MSTDRNQDTGPAGETKAETAARKARDAYETARTRGTAAYDSARERAEDAYGTARENLAANPGAAVLGGLALGALIAAVLPGTRRENQTLGKVGRRVRDTAREAARAARDEGVRKLDELGLNRDVAKEKFNALAGNAKEAARSSATAARESVKSSRTPQREDTLSS